MGKKPVAEVVEFTVKAKAITPRNPDSDQEMIELREDLERMGCNELLSRPWGLKSEYMIVEVKLGTPHKFQGTIRAQPNQWTAMKWRKVYEFGTQGEGICTRNEDHASGKFVNPVHSKDGYLTADCKDPRARRVLEFLVPILLPEKGARVTVGMASTILGSFSGKRPVDWGMVFAEQVKKMVAGIGSTKPSGLSPFLFHLYKEHGCLDEDELRYYKATHVEEAYGFEDSGEESKKDDPLDPGTTGAGPSQPVPPEEVTPEAKKTKRKTTPRATGGSRETRRNPQGTDCGFALCMQSVENIQGLATLMKDQLATAQEGYEYLIDTTAQALTAAGGIEIQELVGFIERVSGSGKNQEMQNRIQELEQELREERALAKNYKEASQIYQEAARESTDRAKEVAAGAAKVCIFAENTGETVVAANLFKEGLQTASDFASPNLRKFIRVVTDYQDKMEHTLEEMRRINTSIIGLTAADRGKGKEPAAPEPPAGYKTPDPRRRAEQQEAATRNTAESGAAEEGRGTTKRPHTTGQGSTSKGTPDPIAKRTRAGTGNPGGSTASPAGAEASSQQPRQHPQQQLEFEEGDEYELTRTRGGSAASPLGVSEE
jgi:hypothetical protein